MKWEVSGFVLHVCTLSFASAIRRTSDGASRRSGLWGATILARHLLEIFLNWVMQFVGGFKLDC